MSSSLQMLHLISARPWLMDDYNDWQWRRIVCQVPYKCAVIFCDNSGADIILGVFPFARDLLKSGSKVIHNSGADIILGVFPFARIYSRHALR